MDQQLSLVIVALASITEEYVLALLLNECFVTGHFEAY